MKKLPIALTTALLSLTLLTPVNAAEDLSKLFQPVARGDVSTESIYFVMTDRFANGDTTNDVGGLTGGSSTTGFDPSDIGYWHGGDFKGLTEHLKYIKDMGFTAIWITPPIKQQTVQGNSAAYHGYWGLDFLAVDPHLGTSADFKAFVDGAHSLGMKVILDVVANHTGDIIQYSNGKAFIPADKANAKNPAFLNKLNNYHNMGPSTFEGESTITGDFNSLDDIATEQPEVVQGFIDIWSYWIKTFGIDGLRVDTFRHVDPPFWKKVIPAIQKVAADSGKKSFPIFGEVYDASPENLSSFITSGQTPSLLDFAFNEQFTRYLANFGMSDRLVQLFNADDLYTTSKTSAYGLATFLGNHDMGRIGSPILANAPDKQAALQRTYIANAALLLLRGGPVLYYGDEKGMTGAGGDKLARQDMFATQVDRWKWEQRIGSEPIGDGSSFDSTNPIQSEITKLQQIVLQNPALRNGTQQVLVAQGQLFAASRYAEKQEYIVAFNTAESEKSAALSAMNKSTDWQLLAGSCSATPSSIKVAANSYCLLKAKSLIAKSATTKVSAPKLGNSNDSPLWKQISVTVDKPGYNSVTFLAREKGGKWISLGTADRTTVATSFTAGGLYRTFLHPELFKKKAPLEIVAVLKNSDNKIITSPISKATNS
jgi:glycosidase